VKAEQLQDIAGFKIYPAIPRTRTSGPVVGGHNIRYQHK
jgi:hypothetical protein